MAHDVLLEIGCEEIPARFMPDALAQLEEKAAAGLQELRLSYGQLYAWGTPRRLALIVEGVAEKQEDEVEETRGPSAAVAYDEAGAPTRAAQGFARSQGVPVEELQVKDTPQGRYVFAVRRRPGRPAREVVGGLLHDVIASLRFPKSMRWDGRVRFARPVRWLVALLDGDVVDVEFAGLSSSRESRGHRLLAPGPVAIPSPKAYAQVLRDAFVIVDPDERRSVIWLQAQGVARKVGGRVEEQPELLEELTYLVEFPTAVLGKFDPDYLNLPVEVLTTSMEVHQRYLSVVGDDGKLLPYFVAISNGDPARSSDIARGYERVLSARLADARFFFEEDQKTPLADLFSQLGAILFQEALGTMEQKARRIQRLAGHLGRLLGCSEEETAHAERAAMLAKVDMVTKMVGEFPELQGVMGREYALRSGEPEPVAEAVFEHVLPRHAGDRRPRTVPGALVALADRIDTLTGCFAAGLIPTGSQDPYGLRRAATGAVQICLDHRFAFDLTPLVEMSLSLYEGLPRGGGEKEAAQGAPDTVAQVVSFLQQRLRVILQEGGCRPDVVEAALGATGERIVDAAERARQLQRWRTDEAVAEVLRIYQRAANLARQSEDDTGRVDSALFAHPTEEGLLREIEEAEPAVQQAMDAGDVGAALQRLAALGGAVDAFFDGVLVMDPDPAVRANRLALLVRLRSLFHRVADWSRMEGVG